MERRVSTLPRLQNRISCILNNHPDNSVQQILAQTTNQMDPRKKLNKQTKFIVTLLQTQHAYSKPNGFSGKNTKKIQ